MASAGVPTMNPLGESGRVRGRACTARVLVIESGLRTPCESLQTSGARAWNGHECRTFEWETVTVLCKGSVFSGDFG